MQQTLAAGRFRSLPVGHTVPVFVTPGRQLFQELNNVAGGIALL